MIDADTLGEKGEARFKELCADAGLICNPSTRDRAGWDFIVDFPFEPISLTGTLIEKRSTPISCEIQVKTMWEDGTKAVMRLTSAERLAKDSRPAFIVVLKVSRLSLEFNKSLQIIHVLDAPLAQILKRLRLEDGKRNMKPNDSEISLSPNRYGATISMTGTALRGALTEACKDGMFEYAKRKQVQIKSLGFENSPYTVKVKVPAIAMSGFVDAWLGLGAKIEVPGIVATETRFGDTRVMVGADSGPGVLAFNPTPVLGLLTIRSGYLGIPSCFEARVFAPPGMSHLPISLQKMRISTDFFDILLEHSGMTFRSNASISPQTPTGWAAFWRSQLVLAQGGADIKLSSGPNSVSVQQSAPAPEISGPLVQRYLHLCECASDLLKHVGSLVEPRVSLADLEKNATSILEGHGLLHPELSPVGAVLQPKIEFSPEENPSFDLLYVNFCTIGTYKVAFAALTTVTYCDGSNPPKWTAESVGLKRISLVTGDKEDYDRFVAEAIASHPHDQSWLREFAT